VGLVVVGGTSSACTDFFGELLSTLCISLSTDTEILSAFLLPETSAFTLLIDIVAARRLLAIAVVISRASADDARVRRRAAGGTLMFQRPRCLSTRQTDDRSMLANVLSTCIGDVQFLNVSDVPVTF